MPLSANGLLLHSCSRGIYYHVNALTAVACGQT